MPLSVEDVLKAAGSELETAADDDDDDLDGASDTLVANANVYTADVVEAVCGV